MLHEQGYAIENFHLETKKTFLFNNQKVYLMNNGARISKTKRKMIQKCIDKKSNTIRGDFSHVLKDANKWEGFNINNYCWSSHLVEHHSCYQTKVCECLKITGFDNWHTSRTYVHLLSFAYA